MFFVIKSTLAPLYDRPDVHSQRVDEVLHGMAVSVVDGMSGVGMIDGSSGVGVIDGSSGVGEWVYVRTGYRYMGWVQRKHLTPGINDSHTRCYINATTADVLASPKVQAPVLSSLPLGSVVSKSCISQEDWTHIRLADDRTGYIRSAFISAFPPETSRESITKTAELYLNTQYRWGGKTSFGIDCSGLCFMAYWLNGITIYRDAKIKPGFPIKEISPHEAQKGDLLFFPGHVGMLLDESLMIHSSEANNGVKIETLTTKWKSKILTAGTAKLFS